MTPFNKHESKITHGVPYAAIIVLFFILYFVLYPFVIYIRDSKG